jgi:sulfofructose kinase
MTTDAQSAVLCLGVAVLDHVFAMSALPERAEKYRASDFAVVGGGCAANAAAAVARLGGRALLATRLGADRLGDEIVAGLEADGVDCRLARRFAGCRSSLSAVLVDAAGERMIVNYRDERLPEGADWLPDVSSLGIGVVLADTRWPCGAAAGLRAARAAGLPGVLDAERPVREAADAVRLATHLAFSRTGLEDWTGGVDIEAGLAAVAAETGAFVCVTNGAAGVFWRSGAETGHVPAYPVAAVDTLGAGDVWHGAFALALAEGRDEIAAIRFASAAAALKCTRFGGRAGIPTRAEVEALLSKTDAAFAPTSLSMGEVGPESTAFHSLPPCGGVPRLDRGIGRGEPRGTEPASPLPQPLPTRGRGEDAPRPNQSEGEISDAVSARTALPRSRERAT